MAQTLGQIPLTAQTYTKQEADAELAKKANIFKLVDYFIHTATGDVFNIYPNSSYEYGVPEFRGPNDSRIYVEQITTQDGTELKWRYSESSGAMANATEGVVPEILDFGSGLVFSRLFQVVYSNEISGLVPATRKVNGKKLTSDITLTPDDVDSLGDKGSQTLAGTLDIVGNDSSGSRGLRIIEGATFGQRYDAEYGSERMTFYNQGEVSGGASFQIDKTGFLALLADTLRFSSLVSYAVNDICVYSGAFYRCITAHLGAWGIGSDFTRIFNIGTDAEPTSASANLMLSGGVYTALAQKADAASVPTAYTSAPQMAGTANAGSASSGYARGNHVHPAETSKDTSYLLPNVCFPITFEYSGTSYSLSDSEVEISFSDANTLALICASMPTVAKWICDFDATTFVCSGRNYNLSNLQFGGVSCAPGTYPTVVPSTELYVRGVAVAKKTELIDQTFDFSVSQEVLNAVAACVSALGGSVINLTQSNP